MITNKSYKISEGDLKIFLDIWRYHQPNKPEKELRELLQYTNEGVIFRILLPNNYETTIARHKKGLNK